MRSGCTRHPAMPTMRTMSASPPPPIVIAQADDTAEQVVVDPAFEDVPEVTNDLPIKDLAEAWGDVRADTNIQFAPVEIEAEVIEPPPDWLLALEEFLGDVFGPVINFMAGNWAILWPILAALAIALILYLLWRIFGAGSRSKNSDAQDEEVEEEWIPQTQEAVALLKDADRLAAEGRYDEATHLLLRRSVSQINGSRPDLIEPSSTAREIAALSALPANARTAFTVIADRVERSLFALRNLDQDDWTAARAAYADFAKIGSQIAPQERAA